MHAALPVTGSDSNDRGWHVCNFAEHTQEHTQEHQVQPLPATLLHACHACRCVLLVQHVLALQA